MVNVMGDALATGIMAHICRKDFVKEGEQVRASWSNEWTLQESALCTHHFIIPNFIIDDPGCLDLCTEQAVLFTLFEKETEKWCVGVI